jgi:uncharacterized protein (DUF983 family)
MPPLDAPAVWRNTALAVPLPKRPLWRAMARGFRGRCPHCGEGKLFRAFLKPVMACGRCGEDLSHQRADDAPPYFTILIVGHIIVPLMVTAALFTEFSTTTHLAIWLPLTTVLALGLIQPIKGALIGLQWALYMHGFDTRSDPDAMPVAIAKTRDGV